MTQANDQDDLDTLLRRAIGGRPLPPAPTNLSARAAQMGREQEAVAARARIERLAHRRKWNVLISAVATFLVAAVVYFGATRIQANLSTNSTLQSNSSDSSTSSSSSSQQNTINVVMLLTAEGLVVALILLSAASTTGTSTPVRPGY